MRQAKHMYGDPHYWICYLWIFSLLKFIHNPRIIIVLLCLITDMHMLGTVRNLGDEQAQSQLRVGKMTLHVPALILSASVLWIVSLVPWFSHPDFCIWFCCLNGPQYCCLEFLSTRICDVGEGENSCVREALFNVSYCAGEHEFSVDKPTSYIQ